MATPKCLIGHPERVDYLTKLAVESAGKCTRGERLCLNTAHHAMMREHWNATSQDEALRRSQTEMGLCHSKYHRDPEHDMAVATKGHRRVGKSDGYCLSCHPPKASVEQGPDYGTCTGCHDYSHLYVFLRDECIAYWVEQDAAEAHGEHRRITYPLHSGDETRIGRFEKVKAVHRKEKTWSGSQWRLLTCLYDHHSSQLVGRVAIPNTPLVYDVFVESTVAVIVPKKGGQLHQATKVGRKLTVDESRRVTKAADTFVKAYWAKVPAKRR